MERKRLILVGNGLDLSLGLKTGYQDFALWFFKEELRTVIKNGVYNFNRLHALDHSFCISKLKNGVHIHGEFEESLSKFLLDLNKIDILHETEKCLKKNNLKIEWKLPFLERLFNCDTWADIEHSYFTSLIQSISPIDNKSENIVGLEQNQLNKVKRLNSKFDKVKARLIEYISTQNVGVDAILKSHDYQRSRFKNIFTSKTNLSETWDLILDFNYTDTISTTLSNNWDWSVIPLIKIHGNLIISDLSNPIIFGFGDDIDVNYKNLESLNQNEYMRHLKSHFYSQNKNYDMLLHFLSNPVKSVANFEVHIIGHSCGLSDRTMLKTIFEHDNCAAIYNYHWRDNEEDALKDHFEKDINVSRHFDDKIKKRSRFKPFDFSLKY